MGPARISCCYLAVDCYCRYYTIKISIWTCYVRVVSKSYWFLVVEAKE